MHLLFTNDISPPLSTREIIDFIDTPYKEDTVPEEFKDYIKIGPVIKLLDITKVPIGLTKKEYTTLLKEIKEEISKLKFNIREVQGNLTLNLPESEYKIGSLEYDIEKKIEREKNIKKKIETIGMKFDKSNLERAKAVPIDSLIKVERGFAKCVFHGVERTPSMKFYPKENRVYCFSCNKGGDSVDVVMIINNLTLSEAIKLLSRS